MMPANAAVTGLADSGRRCNGHASRPLPSPFAHCRQPRGLTIVATVVVATAVQFPLRLG